MKRKTKKIIGGILIGIVAWILFILAVELPFETFLGIVFTGGSILLLAYWIVDRFIQKRKVRKLREASLRAEIHSLKSQIDPHFLFNTLNNLYGLTVEKSELAPQMILKLSDMLRYTIYEGEKEAVTLKDEVAYLENFIELHKIRYHRKVEVTFEKFLEDEAEMLPPLLFINLLENAFKHGAESLSEDAFIHIRLASMVRNIHFEVENNFEPNDSNHEGIGLKNLARRMELLFPGKHTLTFGPREGNLYKAILKADLS